ncbi:PREDICTED: uncharacterized protein LOC104699200 [Camelina sativa]|uniref:Uncharacterized protein LOC104699200 n=1 Tax=Camelina sativa TaxID=90675 RepID=A0ABM1RSE6_CAMSA|nr:PREDICTED: uncharacterized protein LOC104699200 [Camelina sativa]
MGGKEEKGKMVCSVCKKTGHTLDTCFQVIGYPEWWSERSRGIGGFARGGGRQGTGRGRGGMARANVMVAQDGAETSVEAERSGYTGLTNEQWGKLVKLLESSKGNTPRLSGLKCNLIYVSQLVADLDVVMQIADKGCVIQDRITRSVTGAGELKDRLYFFRRLREFRVLHLNKDGAEDLWHQRLGYPSNGVFDLLPVVDNRNKDFSVCDICLKAKHCCESDNGTKFISLASEFQRMGIIHQTSCVGTPQQNGRVERKHRHILNVAWALLFQSSLSAKFWGESVLTADYLINRTPSRLLKGKTPYELIYNKTPAYENLRVFGCLAFAHKQRRGGDKFKARSRKCIFLGYPFEKKGWNIFDLETEELFVSRDVVFVENAFPMSSEVLVDMRADDDISDFGWEEEDEDERILEESLELRDTQVAQESDIENSETEEHSCVKTEEHPRAEPEDHREEQTEEIVVLQDSESENEDSESENLAHVERFGPCLRVTKSPSKFKDYVMNTIIKIESDENILYPLSDYLDATNFSAPFLAFFATVSENTEPETF